jgi:hypothetical protein
VSQTASVWVVLLVALVAANLPFFNDRLFGVVPLPTKPKSLAVRLPNWWSCTFWLAASACCSSAGQGRSPPQGWEFYAVTGALFIVLAFPGFTWRYLMKHRH